jgi:CRP-like cAMP-binding protein
MAGTGIHQSSIQNHLLRRLASEQLDRLCPHLELVELPLRLVLQSRGQPVEFAYFPESAVASFIVPLTDGGSVEVGMVGREGMIGSGIVLGSDTAAHDAMIQIPGKALRISWGSLRDAIRQDADLQQHLLHYLPVFQFQIAQTAACNASHDVEQRCAKWILIARDKAGSDEFPLTHEFLSVMLAVRRAGVTIAVGLLQKAGLIDNQRGRVAILDGKGLEDVACECYGLIMEQERQLAV